MLEFMSWYMVDRDNIEMEEWVSGDTWSISIEGNDIRITNMVAYMAGGIDK